MMKPKLLWFSLLTCNGNAHALLNHPRLATFMERFEWVYHPLLPSSYALADVLRHDLPCDILLIEGAFDPGMQKEGIQVADRLMRYAQKARHVVTLGTCAAFGGIFAEASETRSGFLYDKTQPRDLPIEIIEKSVALPGCPVHPQIVTQTLYALADGHPLPLDDMRRPKHFYATTVHAGCTRNEYYEYKIDRYRYGEAEGCLYIEHGCQAPHTRGSCNRLLWNGVSTKPRSGAPCLGCTEPTFPAKNLWQTPKHMGIPARMPLGVPKRAYLSLAGIAKAFKIPRLEGKLFDDEEA